MTVAEQLNTGKARQPHCSAHGRQARRAAAKSLDTCLSVTEVGRDYFERAARTHINATIQPDCVVETKYASYMVSLVVPGGRTIPVADRGPSSGACNGAPDVEALLLNGIGAGLFEEQIHVNLRHTLQGSTDRGQTHYLIDEFLCLFGGNGLAPLLVDPLGLIA